LSASELSNNSNPRTRLLPPTRLNTQRRKEVKNLVSKLFKRVIPKANAERLALELIKKVATDAAKRGAELMQRRSFRAFLQKFENQKRLNTLKILKSARPKTQRALKRLLFLIRLQKAAEAKKEARRSVEARRTIAARIEEEARAERARRAEAIRASKAKSAARQPKAIEAHLKKMRQNRR
jgi:hypothetical protein